MGTVIKFFFALLTALLTAIVTSKPLAKPIATRPLWSPMATQARKRILLPPAITLVTRAMSIIFWSNSSGCWSARSPRPSRPRLVAKRR